MKTLKQLQVEHVANILTTAMEEIATEMEMTIKDIRDSNYLFCKGRKMLKSGIERYSIILNRFNRLLSKYPVRDGYDYDLRKDDKLSSRFSIVRDFYYVTLN